MNKIVRPKLFSSQPTFFHLIHLLHRSQTMLFKDVYFLSGFLLLLR